MWSQELNVGRGLVLAAVAMLLAGAGAAHAQGLRLAWDRCGDAGTTNKTFSCNTDAGSDTLVVSILPTFSIPKFGHADLRMSVCFAANQIPDWWQVFADGSCRVGALTTVAPSLNDNCPPAWDPSTGSLQSVAFAAGSTLYGFLMYVDVAAADTSKALDLVAGHEVGLVRLVLAHTRSAGTGACAGCNLGAGIAVYFAWLYSTNGDGIGYSAGSYATWQDGSLVCRAVTPVKNRTWGSLKSLYR